MVKIQAGSAIEVDRIDDKLDSPGWSTIVETEDDHYAIEALVEWLNQQDDFGMDLNNTYFRIISENQVYTF